MFITLPNERTINTDTLTYIAPAKLDFAHISDPDAFVVHFTGGGFLTVTSTEAAYIAQVLDADNGYVEPEPGAPPPELSLTSRIANLIRDTPAGLTLHEVQTHPSLPPDYAQVIAEAMHKLSLEGIIKARRPIDGEPRWYHASIPSDIHGVPAEW